MASHAQSLVNLQSKVKTPRPPHSLISRLSTPGWETIFYVGLLIAAVLTRFIGLGHRVMSHDESLQTYYAWSLYKTGVYEHDSFLHGPVMTYLTALSFCLFGDNDFTARISPALLGVTIVLMPKLLFERWLGKFGAMATSVLLLISPMILYYSRYNREDTPALFFVMLMLYSIFAYLDGKKLRQLRYLLLFAITTCLALASKENVLFHFGVFFAMLLLFWLFQQAKASLLTFKLTTTGIIIGAVGAVVIVCILQLAWPTRFSWQPDQSIVESDVVVRLVLWIALSVLGLALAILVPALVQLRSHLPWRRVVFLSVIALGFGMILTWVEENHRRNIPDLWPDYNSLTAYLWTLCIIAIAVTLWLRFSTSFFVRAQQFPVFDLLVILGTLILPWLSAIPLALTNHEIHAAIAYPPDTVNLFLLMILPMTLISITVGLCWQPRTWLLCATAFYGLFFILFTGAFTNIWGIVSGLGGTLGELVWQEVSPRGSQPVYFYHLIQLPIYEFLPTIGSLIAGIAGLWSLWSSGANKRERLDRLPFLIFVGTWAALIQIIFVALRYKMPWLTMNLTIPMIFVAGWYIGSLLDKAKRKARQFPAHAILASGASPM